MLLQVHAASDKLSQLFVETLYKYPQLVCLFGHVCSHFVELLSPV